MGDGSGLGENPVIIHIKEESCYLPTGFIGATGVANPLFELVRLITLQKPSNRKLAALAIPVVLV